MSKRGGRGAKYIVILGDFMIDVWLLMSKTGARTSEPHGDVQPRRRVKPELPCERAGAASIVAETIALFTGRPPEQICGLGLWNPSDDARWANLSVAVDGSKIPAAKFRLFRLKGEPRITTLKIRIFGATKGAPPDFEARLDQDPEPETVKLERESIPDHVKQMLRHSTEAVVVADFCKGSVTRNVIRELSDLVPQHVPWFVESKSPRVQEIFCGCNLHTVFFNYREAVRLARTMKSDVVALPTGDQPTLELLEVGQKLVHALRPKHLVITLGRDGAACFSSKEDDEIAFALSYPSQRTEDYSGVSAGDVLMGRWIAGCLSDASCTPATLLNLSGRTAHRWCVFQDVAFWKNDRRDSDAAAPGHDTLSKKQPIWLNATSSLTVAEWEQKLIGRRTYSALLYTDGKYPTVSLKNARLYLGRFISTDRPLGADLIELTEKLKAYAKDGEFTKPYVCVICAQPGSGKSTLAKEVASLTGYEFYPVNVTQLKSPNEFARHLDQIASLSARRRTANDRLPFLFIDEFDKTLISGQHIYGELLSPLLDGTYEVGGLIRHLGRVAVLLVASVAESIDALRESLLKVDSGKDLWSRIQSGVKLSLPPLSKADRVYLAAFIAIRRFDDVKYVEKGVFDFFADCDGMTPREVEELVHRSNVRGDTFKIQDLLEERRDFTPLAKEHCATLENGDQIRVRVIA